MMKDSLNNQNNKNSSFIKFLFLKMFFKKIKSTTPRNPAIINRRAAKGWKVVVFNIHCSECAARQEIFKSVLAKDKGRYSHK